MKIAEVSQKFNLTTDTLRYYEKVGLIEPVKRSKSGVRDYTEKDLDRIVFVKCMRQAGLSIESIQTYIELYKLGDSTLENRLDILLNERDKIEATIFNLQGTLDYLNHKIDRYTENIKKLNQK